MNHKQVMVSICCQTYNHVGYIQEALDSFLMQETDFTFEILLRDDASTDGTAEICKDYATKHPDKINLLAYDENQYVKGVRPLVDNIKRARGKYIALCEGDDYWTDPNKLQKQVDFLEENEEYSGCGHQAIRINEIELTEKVFFKNVAPTLHLKDILFHRKFHTASLMFRSCITKENKFPSNIFSGDRALNFLIASKGPISFLADTMCVYRKNAGGISSKVTVEMLKNDFNMIPWLYNINHNFPRNTYKSIIYKTLFEYPNHIGFWSFIKYYFLYLFYSFSYFPKNIMPVAKFTVGKIYDAMKEIIKK
ncbi:glycosyltransferase [Carboxylicivirga sp. A043]|uniref:glycosyltransferase family 2 protein n=1 Tax=Carboxylicivirga litoralis TaxID=2816963 RepID=UPI0021CAE406|nr:glycosyltransferase [Carboxylicivirga sp. A043]MCU4157535.1 glycosyltransferase [Carboxylicivirga sp. A043]